MSIEIKNAYDNNLKNINLTIPKNALIAFTGVSGSGKSTLALDTIQRECQRLYMESLGMTLNIGSKAKVKSIKGLSPAISITQHQSNNNPRSNVGTITELTSYIRILFSSIGKQTIDKTHTDYIYNLTANHFSFNKPEGACPTCSGIGKINIPDINQIIDMDKSIKDFAIYGWDQVYIDRYGASLINAAKHYGFTIDITIPIKEYNSLQMDLLLYGVLSKEISSRFPSIKEPKTVPLGRFEGVVTNIQRRYSQANITLNNKKKLEQFFKKRPCPTCKGKKWNDKILGIYLNKNNIKDVLQKSIFEVNTWMKELNSSLSIQDRKIVSSIIDTILEKTKRLIDIGVGYLNINQPASSLSSGEWQRIKLTNVIGSGLTGVLYILDEPSAGLHQCDIPKIVYMLKKLRDLGNTVLVIEHNMQIIKEVDHIVDFGPGAGIYGGTIVASGSLEKIMKAKASLTGKYLLEKNIVLKKNPKVANRYLTIENANLHNLKDITVRIPLDCFVSVTGVSGSGKTNLIFGVLATYADNYFNHKQEIIKASIKGLEKMNDVIIINHSSIGRSSRSNVATYTELFKDIRELFALTTNKTNHKLSANYFSTNSKGGRCEECQGNGTLAIQMHFLPEVLTACPVCEGKRYKKEILKVRYNGYNISEILSMNIDSAATVFSKNKNILSKIIILQEVGLGYLNLGQTTSTLSGGEAQRLKLAKELMKQGSRGKLYLFDEPTTGLHHHDVLKMIKIFERIVNQGDSVIVIEHNLSVISSSDYIIDMGPDGGRLGGYVIGEGSPYQIIKNNQGNTSVALAQQLKK